MRIQYYSDTDSIFVYIADGVSALTDVLGEGIQADFDNEGKLIGVEIEHVEFDAKPEAMKGALVKLSARATNDERRQVSLAFDHVLAGLHKQLDPII